MFRYPPCISEQASTVFEEPITPSYINQEPEQKCDFTMSIPTCWCEYNGKKTSAVKVFHRMLIELHPLNCSTSSLNKMSLN